MDGRLFSILLIAALLGPMQATLAQEERPSSPQVIEPEVERRDINRARIDTENFELGGYAGIMSVEDFGTNAVYGARLAYHITESFFIEANYGMTTTDKTSFERLSGGAELLSDSERDLTYYNAVLGYNLFPGEVFLGGSRAMDSSLYLVAGAGSTDFGGDDEFTMVFGFGYRVLPTDSLAFHLNVRDDIFESDLLGQDDTYRNIEAILVLTFFF